jgi:NTP pyrophosphatase (non-canonical NTP hydrolase)
MGELLQALSKFKRHKGDINNIIEEIADVEIMMQQLCLMFECYEEVVAVRRQKIERLKKRLEDEYRS